MAEPKKASRRKTRAKSTAARRNGKSKVEAALNNLEAQPAGTATPIGEAATPRRRRSRKLPAGLETVAIDMAGDGSIDRSTADGASTPEAPPPADVPLEALHQQFITEVNELIARLRQIQPAYNPPPFAPEGLTGVLGQAANIVPPEVQATLFDKARKFISEDMFDADTWRGLWYMVSSSVSMQTSVIQRRLTGEYETDEWGFDREYMEAVRPFFEFLYKTYWRVSLSGVENVPEEGRALLVANHSGQLPFDGSMLGMGILLEHPAQRLVRTLYATWFPTLPFISDLFVKLGQALATEDNGARLLEQDQLVAVFPEGYKGVGKLYKDRYKLARFGRGGFVKMALRSRAPIIPVSIVGAEETYISLAKSDFMAKLTGMPYFPISPTFPWLGLLGFVPLPTKWYIDIGEPIPTDQFPARSEQNLMLVQQMTEQVRNIVQNMILQRLSQRRSIFFG